MSTNISKQKREDLLNKIKEIRTFISAAPQDENTGNLLSYLSDLEKDINGKKYGLVFEEHREEIDEVLDTHTPVLTEDKDLFISNGGQMNFLIEGDNLASLKLLEKTHKGKIDLIYIDPPYNTGVNDFIYDDNFVEKTDLFRHSQWLSFMKNRLQIAYKLLSQNGYIFISIDDNEVAPLTLLCDEIFNESNHINTIAINMNSLSGVKMTHAVKGKRFPAQKEYLLLYKRGATPPQLLIEKKHKEKWDKEYNLIIPELKKEQFDIFATMTDSSVNAVLKNMHLQSLSSYVSEKGIKLTDDWLWKNAYRIFGTKSNRPLANRIKDEKFSQQIMCYTNNDGNIRYFRSDFNRNARDPRIELVQAESNSSIFLSDNWIDISNDGGVAQEGGVIFPNGKKPLQLITRVLRASNNLQAIVLDFFAGSGTTGHAIMKQNAEDGGTRKFILCTNNQNEICKNITYKRLHNVISQDNYHASLKYYKVDYVPISDRLYYEYADELLKHIRELVELENGINFTGNEEIAIVLTEEELASFIENVDDFSKCKKLYMGHNLLPTGEQEEALKNNGIEINIIPDYYYRDLQEK